jgi:type IV fimbrial biogenesis protein FimT
MKPASGFTLIEALVVVAILSVLAAFVVPGVNGAVSAGHAAEERTGLTEALVLALNQSVISGNNVVLCASRDGSSCSGELDWTAGWIAFLDRDEDRERGANDPLLRAHPRLLPGIRLRSSLGRTHVVFQPQGGATAGSNVTFTFCDSRGASKASTIVPAWTCNDTCRQPEANLR